MLAFVRHQKIADKYGQYWWQPMCGSVCMHQLIPCDGSTHDQILLKYGPQCLCTYPWYCVIYNSWPMEWYVKYLVDILSGDGHLSLGQMEGDRGMRWCTHRAGIHVHISTTDRLLCVGCREILANASLVTIWSAIGHIKRVLLICVACYEFGLWVVPEIRSRPLNDWCAECSSYAVGLPTSYSRWGDDLGISDTLFKSSLSMIYRPSGDGHTCIASIGTTTTSTIATEGES